MRITFGTQDEAVEFVNKLQPHLPGIAGVFREFVVEFPDTCKEAAEKVAVENNTNLLTFNIQLGILQK